MPSHPYSLAKWGHSSPEMRALVGPLSIPAHYFFIGQVNELAVSQCLR